MDNQPQSTLGTRKDGEILSQHRLKEGVEQRIVIMLIVGIVTMVAALLWSLYRWLFAFSHFGPAVVWRWTGPAIGIAILALLLAIYSMLFLLRNRQRIVYTTPDGLWLNNRGERRFVSWADIASIQSSAAHYRWLRSNGEPQMRILLRTIGGEVIKIPTFMTALMDLQQLVKEYIYPYAMDRYREMMKSDQVLDFGPLKLSRRGVSYRNHIDPWQNFRDVQLERGRLRVEFQRPNGMKKISIAARSIPNLDLCVQLLRNIEY